MTTTKAKILAQLGYNNPLKTYKTTTHKQDKGRTMHTPQLAQILKDSEYKLELFDKEAIENLEKRIITKDSNGGGGS